MFTEQLRIGGMQTMTTTDYPQMLSAVLFCQGCSWQCHYCHNPQLIPFSVDKNQVSWSYVEEFLQRRVGLLEAVVFSGGEPTLQSALPQAMEVVREMGFKIGLHTAGAVPERLAPILAKTDWVGFDVKAPFSHYSSITGRDSSGEMAKKSLRLLLAAGIEFECRTTFHSSLLSANALLEIAQELSDMGVERYVIQEFRAQGCRTTQLHDTHCSDILYNEEFLTLLSSKFKEFLLRPSQ